MAKAHRKAQARLSARRAKWDYDFGKRDGFKRPGSYKKPQPHGRGRAHAPR